MKTLIALALMLSFSAAVSAAPKQQPFTTTYYGCNDGGNGLGASADNSPVGTPGQSGRTRRGNNGKGNDGEAVDVYITAAFGQIVHIDYYCYSTDSEDSEGGSRYINGNYDGPSFGSEFELDPGRL